jgi:methylated-DNA-protein-cysteine methyltransferase-like protein
MDARLKRDLLGLIHAIPRGRVATADALAAHLKTLQPLVATLLNHLTEEERDANPWHRVVAKGGAIGRGPNRDAQFARLLREGVPVSPAGVVQDMDRLSITAAALANLAAVKPRAPDREEPPPLSPARSRGMKDRPGGGLR